MNRLLRLLADNRGVKDAARRFEVLNAEADEATVYLYDMIVSSKADAEWWGGVAAETFVKDFAAITAPTIHLRINSPGGDVFAARAMEQAVRAHPSNVIAHVDGYAASAATYLALAGDEVEIVDGGFFMIHQSWSIAMGNATEFRKTADLLDQIDATIVSTYAKRTNLDEAALRDMLAAETWIGAQQAVEQGWADRIAGEQPKDRVNWNVSSLLESSISAALSVAAGKQRQAAQDLAAAAAANAAAAAPGESRELALRRLNHYERIAA